MTQTSLIIDCDPGVDDAIALFLAFASKDLNILAVTTVGGNVSGDLTARNARLLRQIAGREDVPVYAGAANPLVRNALDASHFHGASGLGDLPVFSPTAPLARGQAALAIIDLVMARPAGSVTIAVTGPMTNLALAMRMEPQLAARLGPVVVMGGARREGGNITASAEYNIYADPHAAELVLRSGAKCVFLGLDATHQVRVTAERLARFGALTSPVGKAAANLLTFSRKVELANTGINDAPLHDPCPIAYIIAPHLFTTVPAYIQVECASALTLGHTQVEFRPQVEPRVADSTRSALWVTQARADAIFDLIIERLSA